MFDLERFLKNCIFQPVEKSSALRSKNNTGECCSNPSGGSQSAGAPGTPEPGAGTWIVVLPFK